MLGEQLQVLAQAGRRDVAMLLWKIMATLRLGVQLLDCWKNKVQEEAGLDRRDLHVQFIFWARSLMPPPRTKTKDVPAQGPSHQDFCNYEYICLWSKQLNILLVRLTVNIMISLAAGDLLY